MTNTTDMIITCFEEDAIIADISNKTGVDFLQTSNGCKSGGTKTLSFESYGACYRSLGKDKIEEIISAFRSAEFTWPELAVLVIDDDDGNFSGIVTLEL